MSLVLNDNRELTEGTKMGSECQSFRSATKNALRPNTLVMQGTSRVSVSIEWIECNFPGMRGAQGQLILMQYFVYCICHG